MNDERPTPEGALQDEKESFENGTYTGELDVPGMGVGEYTVDIVTLSEEDEEVEGMHDAVSKVLFEPGQQVMRVRQKGVEAAPQTFTVAVMQLFNEDINLSPLEQE